MKIEVHLQGGLRKIIDITPGATIGATIGTNVYNADGTLFVPAAGGGSQPVAVTSWELILNIPPNVTALANTVTTGLYAITAAGASATRSITPVAGETTVTNGDGVAGDPQIGLADVTPSAGGSIQRLGFDAKGRRSEADTATTDNLSEGATNLYFTDARAQAAVVVPTITNGDTTHAPSGDAVFDALAGKEPTIAGGTAGQFWRGDKTFSNTILGPLVVASPTSPSFAEAISPGGIDLVMSANDGLNLGFFGTLGNHDMCLFRDSTGGLRIDVAFNVKPFFDNFAKLGDASFRWSEVFAANAAINTSDARDKTDPRDLNEVELRCASDLACLPSIFQWLDAKDLKGEGARLHCSPTVQSVVSCMQSHGLDPFRYGFVCYDEWVEQPEKFIHIDAVLEERDESGNITRPARGEIRKKVQDYRPAGDRYSLRPSELQFFIARGQEERLRRLEALLNP